MLAVAVIDVRLALVAPMLPTLALPVTDNMPEVMRLPPVILPVAVTVLAEISAEEPDSTTCAPSGVVSMREVALADICALPRYMVEFDNQMSFHRLVVLPRSYVTLAVGMRLLPTVPVTAKLPVKSGLWLTANVIVSVVALAVIMRLSAGVNVTVSPTISASTAVPLA